MKIFAKIIVVVMCLFYGMAFPQQYRNREPMPNQASIVQEQQSSQNWIGNGGKGMSITIYAIQPVGLDLDAQISLPARIQTEFVSVFSTYSAISVLDWENLDNILVKLTDGVYDENAEVVKNIGRFTPTTHYLTGKIAKTELGYHLQINITRTADKMVAVSCTKTFELFAGLDPFRDIRLVSYELLQGMGVTLTEKGRMELTGGIVTKQQMVQADVINAVIAQQEAAMRSQSQSNAEAKAHVEELKEIQEAQRQARIRYVETLNANPKVAQLRNFIEMANQTKQSAVANYTVGNKQQSDVSAPISAKIAEVENLIGKLCALDKNDNRCGNLMRALGEYYCQQDHIGAGHELKSGCPIIDHHRSVAINQRLLREYPNFQNLPTRCPYCGVNTGKATP